MPVTYLRTSSRFDTSLSFPADFENASTLTLLLRIAFFQLEPSPGHVTLKDHTGRKFTILSWESAAFTQYVNEFKKTVEEIWNGKLFILLPDPKVPLVALPPHDYEVFQSQDKRTREKYPPFLRCALEIRPQVDEVGSHATLTIARLPANAPPFGSYTHERTRRGPEHNLLTDRDLKVAARTPAETEEKDLYHQAASHEVGHLLGLHHINRMDPACKEGNEEICYGATGYSSRDIMGKGMAIDASSAGPWLDSIRDMTGHPNGWTATHLSPPLEALLHP